MARRALLRISSFEHRYQQEYGTLPDYDLDRLRADPSTCADAVRIWQERLDTLWSVMKHEHEHRYDNTGAFMPFDPGAGCPFQ